MSWHDKREVPCTVSVTENMLWGVGYRELFSSIPRSGQLLVLYHCRMILISTIIHVTQFQDANRSSYIGTLYIPNQLADD